MYFLDLEKLFPKSSNELVVTCTSWADFLQKQPFSSGVYFCCLGIFFSLTLFYLKLLWLARLYWFLCSWKISYVSMVAFLRPYSVFPIVSYAQKCLPFGYFLSSVSDLIFLYRIHCCPLWSLDASCIDVSSWWPVCAVIYCVWFFLVNWFLLFVDHNRQYNYLYRWSLSLQYFLVISWT